MTKEQKPGRPKGPELTAARAKLIRAAAKRHRDALVRAAVAEEVLVEQLRAGRAEGAALRDLGEAAGRAVSNVHKLVAGASA